MNQEYPSALLERAVKEFTKLPGIGRKTATRLVLHLLRKREDEVAGFSDAIITLKREAKYCTECHSISDTDICPICANPLLWRTQCSTAAYTTFWVVLYHPWTEYRPVIYR